MEENKNNVYSVEELIKNMLDSCKKYNYKEVPITKRELELVLSSLKIEEIYKKEIKELKSSLKGEKYLGQEVAKLDFGDIILVKSQTEDGKLCWIVENKEENIKPDYIEAFENIIFQKRDNGYISDAYRNDISVVYEALHKLEKLKNKEAELINNNKNKEYIQNDIELTHKLVKEAMEEFYDKCGIPKKYRNPNNIPGEIKIPTVTKNHLEKIKENKGEDIMKDYSTKYGSNTTVESFSETQKNGKTYKIFVGDENPSSDHTNSKLVEESISKIQKIKGEKNNMNRLTKKIETKNNGDLAIDNYEVVDKGNIKNDTAFAIDKLGRIEDLEEEQCCSVEEAFATTKLYEEKYEKEQEDTRKNVIEYFKKSEMDSLSMLADIQYLVLNEMDGLRNKWLWKLYFNKIREDLQSFHGTEQASDEEEVDVNEGEE